MVGHTPPAFFAVQALLALLGVVLVAGGLLGIKNILAAVRTDQSAVGTLSEGVVEFEATIESGTEPLTSPLGADCVAYEYEAAPRTVGDESESSGGHAVPFRASDGTGEVVVDPIPRNADLAATPGLSGRLLDRETGVPAIAWPVDYGTVETVTADADLAERVSDPTTDVTAGDSILLRENRLRAGGDVYVLGRYVPASPAHGGEDVVVNRRWRPFYLAPGDEGGSLRGMVVGGTVVFVAGFLFLWVGVPGLLEAVGIQPPVESPIQWLLRR